MKRTGLPTFLRAHSLLCTAAALAFVSAQATLASAQANAERELATPLQSIASTDGTPDSDSKAADAVKMLQSADSQSVIDVLSAFDGATKRGRNWLRALAADVADNGSFPRQALLTFYQDRSNDADARYVAYQLLLQDEPSSKSNLLETAETDPSLPIRYLKIAAMIDQAAANLESDKPSAQQTLQAVIADGRSPKQLEKATDLLKELGVQVDLADELGLIQKWSVIGPFDNTDSEDFDTVYLPESRYLDLGTPIGTDKSGTVQPEKGKRGEVEWQTVETDDRLGMVDLNPPLENEKDGCAYAFATFTVDSGYTGTAQTRLGCITANKVWVNGKLASSDNVYHSGTRIDQYIGTCELVEGENTVMIKVLQNAQTQPWAQDWEFQFRLTRPNGSAIKTTVVD